MTTSGAENPDPAVAAAGSEGEPTVALGSGTPAAGAPAAWDDDWNRAFTGRSGKSGPSLPVSISATALLIGAVACVIAFFAINGPVHSVAGEPQPNAELIRQEPPPTRGNPPAASSTEPASTTQPTQPPPSTVTLPATPVGAMAALAGHPLSTSNAMMPATACSLSRFDPADDRQATFFQEAKKCADAGWSAVLSAAGMPMPTIEVVTVHGGPASTPCGPVNPTDRPTQCGKTVYMTPAYLRDIEQNGRYPGRYFGVFLFQYAKAMQDATGLTVLYGAVRSQPGAAVADLDARFGQQATCLAGMASGAMAGQGAVDGNITSEIRDRLLSTKDAPADAATWLARGFQARTLSACNSWAA